MHLNHSVLVRWERNFIYDVQAIFFASNASFQLIIIFCHIQHNILFLCNIYVELEEYECDTSVSA